MNKIFIEKMKNDLLSQKSDLLNKFNQSVDIDIDGDDTDIIQGNMILELANQLSMRDADKLLRINSALQRISELTYGVCQDCEEDIAEQRLKANPCFLLCVSCAERRERDEKQKRRA